MTDEEEKDSPRHPEMLVRLLSDEGRRCVREQLAAIARDRHREVTRMGLVGGVLENEAPR